MKKRLCLIVLPLTVLSMSCGTSTDHTVPKAICGTPIDPALTRLVVRSTEELHEFNRVDRAEAITAPCVLLSKHDPVLEFGFSWDDTEMNLMYLATGNGTISRVTAPQSVNLGYKTLVGTDGAISIAPCKTNGGAYFTLTLQVPWIKLTDQTHRGDIERFMRAYFPATLRTLGCR